MESPTLISMTDSFDPLNRETANFNETHRFRIFVSVLNRINVQYSTLNGRTTNDGLPWNVSLGEIVSSSK